MAIDGRLLTTHEEWTLAAACRGRSGLFFPPDHLESKIERRRREATAKALCQSCRVRVECLSQAVNERERFGIWGGLNERERRATFARLHVQSPQDIAGPGRPIHLPAAAVRGPAVSTTGR